MSDNPSMTIDEFYSRYPRYVSLRSLVPDATVLRLLASRVDVFERLLAEARIRIPVVNLERVLGREAEGHPIVLQGFLGHWGNVSIEEVAKIALVTRAVQPRTVLEIGTFNGMTTLQIALNAPKSCKVYTLDLPAGAGPSFAHDELDTIVARQARGRFGTDLGSYFDGYHDREIVQLRGDSCTFDYGVAIGTPLDLVLVDGGHNYKTVRADTERTLPLLAPGGVMLWHNYADLAYPDVTQYLGELSRDIPLMQLRNTMIAIYRKSK